MSDELSAAPESLWPQILPQDALRRDGAAVLRRFAAGEAERTAIARGLDLPSLDRLEFDARLAPHGDDGWRLDGEVRAAGAQRCGVTLEPAPFEMVEPVLRLWSPSAPAPSDDDLWEVDATDLLAAADRLDELEELEKLPDPIDLGAVALEAFCLALDPYPRAPSAQFDGASAAPPGVEPLSDEAVRPFAALASLVGGAAPDGTAATSDDAGQESAAAQDPSDDRRQERRQERGQDGRNDDRADDPDEPSPR